MSSPINLRSDFEVDLIEHAGDDEFICKAARVSTMGSDSIDSEESSGLINFLMKNRHGSPFEHGMLVFRIKAPIFVWREFMRHRVGVSYNEQSGRYMELSPEFYIPPRHRALTQEGKPGEYRFIPGSDEQWDIMCDSLAGAYDQAWYNYKHQMMFGIAKEVARMCLPVAIYSSAYVTMNPRSIMHFLGLRTDRNNATFPSKPMWEINQVANLIEGHFASVFPSTYSAFENNGRVCP